MSRICGAIWIWTERKRKGPGPLPWRGFQQKCVLAVFTGVRPLRCGFGAQTDVIIQHPIVSQHVPHLHQQIR